MSLFNEKAVESVKRQLLTRMILHIDMDHFYTAIEEREHPEYKGKAVIVGADPKIGKGRGVVSTSNYEARRVGIKSGMPISHAWRLCPEAVFLPPNFPLYVSVSNEIMGLIRKNAEKFEQWGIDEAFLDVSQKVRGFEEAENLASRIKLEIKETQGLTCSIGVGPNKLVAKIASDFKKPDGLTVVRPEQVETFLAPLPIRKLLWVGRKTAAKLNSLGILTIGDLATYDPSVLIEMFGVMGAQIHQMACGIDNSRVEERTEIKSMSHETTFEEDEGNAQTVLEALYKLSEDIIDEVVAQNLLFKTITVKIRYENFETHTHSRTLPFMTNRLHDLKKTAVELLRYYVQPERKIRLIGVRVSSLASGKKQKTLA
jgi:DNA polymerase IV (DinB-like DNA polymerase)